MAELDHLESYECCGERMLLVTVSANANGNNVRLQCQSCRAEVAGHRKYDRDREPWQGLDALGGFLTPFVAPSFRPSTPNGTPPKVPSGARDRFPRR